MNHVIILEGPDGGGKTSLANHLRDRYGYQIRKTNQPRPGEDLFVSYTQDLLQALTHWRFVVFDRHYLGECVYGPIMRGVDTLGEMGRTLIERVCAANGVPVVICQPTYRTLTENWKAKKGNDYLQTDDQLAKISEAYCFQKERMYDLEFARSYTYDVDDQEEYNQIMFEPLRRLPPGYSGYPEATVLVVGDQVNHNAVTWDLPFHDLGGSSKYLYDQIKSIGVAERDLAWVNSRDRGGVSRDLAEVIDLMPHLKRVVALGDSAARICRKNFDLPTVEVHVIPHPQYYKRFRAGLELEYQQLLKEAMGL